MLGVVMGLWGQAPPFQVGDRVEIDVIMAGAPERSMWRPGTVKGYESGGRHVEAGSGIGIVPESVIPETAGVTLIPLKPVVTIPLVMVWSRDGDDPAVTAFRQIVGEWLKSRKKPRRA